MSTYRVKVEATAIIEETWLIDTPRGVELDEESAAEILHNVPEGYRLRFIDERSVENSEDNRTVIKVGRL